VHNLSHIKKKILVYGNLGNRSNSLIFLLETQTQRLIQTFFFIVGSATEYTRALNGFEIKTQKNALH
jgi:hypothetical protein